MFDMKKLTWLVLIFFILLVIPVKSHIVYPTDDAFISAISTSWNTGSENYLRLANAGFPYIERAYLKFDIPEPCPAKLNIFHTLSASGANITLFTSNNDWNENTLKWNNQPCDDYINYSIVYWFNGTDHLCNSKTYYCIHTGNDYYPLDDYNFIQTYNGCAKIYSFPVTTSWGDSKIINYSNSYPYIITNWTSYGRIVYSLELGNMTKGNITFMLSLDENSVSNGDFQYFASKESDGYVDYEYFGDIRPSITLDCETDPLETITTTSTTSTISTTTTTSTSTTSTTSTTTTTTTTTTPPTRIPPPIKRKWTCWYESKCAFHVVSHKTFYLCKPIKKCGYK